MKRILKLTIKFLLYSLFTAGAIIFIITTFFSTRIEKGVINKIQENLEAPLILEDVEFTIYDNFPYASVKITNLLLLESKEFNEDTLLFAKLAYVEISILDIINKNYNLENITIIDGNINIKYNNSNTPNFLIIKTPTNNNARPLLIKNIITLNTKLKIHKKISGFKMNWDLKRSIISVYDQDYSFNAEGISNNLNINNTNYMDMKKFAFSAETKIKKDTIKILKSDLKLENIIFNISGSIAKGNSLNLEIKAQEQKISQIITHLPKNIQYICHPFIADGKITFQSYLKGVMNKEKNPLLKMDYKINEGQFKLKSIPFELYDVQINGSINNGEDKNFNSTTIKSDLFKAATKKGWIDGKFILNNLNNYFLTAQFTSSWDLTEVNQYFEDSPFIGLTGNMIANTDYQGNIAFNKNFKKTFLNANHKSNIKLNNLNFNYNIFPLKFTFKSVDCNIENHKIVIDTCKSTISETDLDFQGDIINLIAYILGEAPKIYVNGNIKSTYTNFSEIMTLSNLSNSKKGKIKKNRYIMPNWINSNTSIDIKNFSYNNLVGSDVNGILSYKNRALNGSNLSIHALNGEINGNFNLSEPINNNLKLTTNLNIKQINIRNSFDAFNNYGQTFIMNDQLKGVGSGDIKIESHWKPDFLLDKNKLKINSHLIIEKGELIDFKPLENLSSYISLDELKHVKFSTLENTIDVKNKVITIPLMEIKSSALSVLLSGTHTFNQEINYEVTLLLSELLSSSFRKKNTQITEFGEQQQDGKIFNTVYFKMTGNTNNPKISLNKIRFMQDINNNVKKEKEIIKNIIKEDILQTTEKKEKEKGQEIEIDWDPEL